MCETNCYFGSKKTVLGSTRPDATRASADLKPLRFIIELFLLASANMSHSGFPQDYLHLHSRAMPGWTDNGWLLAQRVDGMLAIAQACQEDPMYSKFLGEIQLRHVAPSSNVICG